MTTFPGLMNPMRALSDFDRYSIDPMQIRRNAPSKNRNFPPYDFIQTEKGKYKIRVAVAGFKSDELDVQLSDKSLIIKGEKKEKEPYNFIVKGIGMRSFEQSYPIDSNAIEIEDVSLSNGLLEVDFYVKDINSENGRSFTINEK